MRTDGLSVLCREKERTQPLVWRMINEQPRIASIPSLAASFEEVPRPSAPIDAVSLASSTPSPSLSVIMETENEARLTAENEALKGGKWGQPKMRSDWLIGAE